MSAIPLPVLSLQMILHSRMVPCNYLQPSTNPVQLSFWALAGRWVRVFLSQGCTALYLTIHSVLECNPSLKKLSFHDVNLAEHQKEVLLLLQDPVLQGIANSWVLVL